MVEKALEFLRTPRTPWELAQALGLTPEGAELLLAHLWRRGYVKPLPCGVGCQTCAFSGACLGTQEPYWIRLEQPNPLADAPRTR